MLNQLAAYGASYRYELEPQFEGTISEGAAVWIISYLLKIQLSQKVNLLNG